MALRLTAITLSESSSGISTTLPSSSIPAELSRPVIVPSAAARSATRPQSAIRVTSAVTGWMRPDAIDWRPASLMSTATTVAPQSAKWMAASRPSPDAAPVTITTPESFATPWRSAAPVPLKGPYSAALAGKPQDVCPICVSRTYLAK